MASGQAISLGTFPAPAVWRTPSHLTFSLPAPQVSCPSAPQAPWAKLFCADLSQAPQGLPRSRPAPWGPKAVLPREGPSPPCSFLGPSFKSHSECYVRSPHFCFSALCSGWAGGCNMWTSSPRIGWFPRSHLAQVGHRHHCTRAAELSSPRKVLGKAFVSSVCHV